MITRLLLLAMLLPLAGLSQVQAQAGGPTNGTLK